MLDIQAELFQRSAPGTVAIVYGDLPTCDVCRLAGRTRRPARYDAAYEKPGSPWAFMCGDCYLLHTDLRLGLGRGQYMFELGEVSPRVREAFLRAKDYWRLRGVRVPTHDPFT